MKAATAGEAVGTAALEVKEEVEVKGALPVELLEVAKVAKVAKVAVETRAALTVAVPMAGRSRPTRARAGCPTLRSWALH